MQCWSRQGKWRVLGICLCSPWQCVAAMAPLESVHFSEHVRVM